MTHIEMSGIKVADAMEILYEIRKTDLVQHVDYDFAYYKAEYDTTDILMSGKLASIQMVSDVKRPARVVFSFKDERFASYFILRWGGRVINGNTDA